VLENSVYSVSFTGTNSNTFGTYSTCTPLNKIQRTNLVVRNKELKVVFCFVLFVCLFVCFGEVCDLAITFFIPEVFCKF